MTFDTAREHARLRENSSKLNAWLAEKALPVWWNVGADHKIGGFFERIALDGTPCVGDNRRARVQPRQVYCYATAGKNGWDGPWLEAIDHGMNWFEAVYRLETGLFGNLAAADGTLIDPTFDLYNQAFALFAYAQIATACPERHDEMRAKAEELLRVITATYKHPVAGFEEAHPRRTPLCSNPHMHLFEACLAWNDISGGNAPWGALTNEIAHLAMSRFIDTESGGLREFFDGDWKPFPGDKGRIMEPGHQFEWAWLLARWGMQTGNQEALAKAQRLFEIGEAHGICDTRKVAIMSLYDDFSVHDGLARLWPQTEWLKAAVRLYVLAPESEKGRYLNSANRACDALGQFLQTEVAGLWYDKLPVSGVMVEEPAPASTFYHILCAIVELREVLDM
jgi:mannose/cellobiose epimerase-like protein (N-acyl-D-glucosamine 2-epimerase family)